MISLLVITAAFGWLMSIVTVLAMDRDECNGHKGLLLLFAIIMGWLLIPVMIYETALDVYDALGSRS